MNKKTLRNSEPKTTRFYNIIKEKHLKLIKEDIAKSKGLLCNIENALRGAN